jgi:hypothetical protein
MTLVRTSRAVVFPLAGMAFWVAVLLVPRLFGLISSHPLIAKIRAEDLLAPVFLVYLYLRRGEVRSLLGSPSLRAIALWLGFAFLTTFGNTLARGFPLMLSMGFVGKEAEFIMYFAFFALLTRSFPQLVLSSLALSTVPLYGYAIYQLAVGEYQGYYGIAFPFEAGLTAPSEAGNVAAILFVGLLALALHGDRLVRLAGRGAMVVYPGLTVAFITLLSTLSRANIVAAVSAAALLVAVKVPRLSRFRRSLLWTGMSLALGAAIFSLLPIADELVDRFFGVGSMGVWGRLDAWELPLRYLSDFPTNIPVILVGAGLGSPKFLFPEMYDDATLGVDNQWLRRVFEVGVLGTAVWVGLLVVLAAAIVRAARGKVHGPLLVDALAGTVAVMLVASLAFEIFQVIRTGSVFYALLGVLWGLARLGPRDPAGG